MLPGGSGHGGESKSTVSRRFTEAGTAQLAALNQRSLVELSVLVLAIVTSMAAMAIRAAAGLDEIPGPIADREHRTVLRAAATWNARRSGRVRTVERARLPPGRPDPCVDRAP